LRSGWLGSFTSVSLRGADIQHTQVLLGDIPLTYADAAAFDLSTVPVSTLDRIVVFRGGAPAWLDQGAIGGVLQLVPREADGTSLAATATAGSFSTFGGTAISNVSGAPDAPRLVASVGVLGSRGDFVFRSDNNTTFDTSDDYDTRRKNADFVEGHGLLHVRQKIGPGDLELVMLGYERAGGEPGSPADPAYLARRNLTRGLLGADYTYEHPGANGEPALRLQALAAGSFTRARFSDLFMEIGAATPKSTDELDEHAFGRLAGSFALADFLELTMIGAGEHDTRSLDSAFALMPQPDAWRSDGSATGELRLHGRVAGRSVELRPSLRVETTSAHLNAQTFSDVVSTHASETEATYRAAAAAELLPGVSLSASISSGARMPNLLELFGDNAFILGNNALSPEHSTSYDAGIVAVLRRADVAGSLELHGFNLDIDDQIVFVRNAQSQLFPLNLTHSHILGVEAGTQFGFGRHVWLNGSTTLMHTEGKPGKQLPNRPRAVALVQPGASTGPLGPLDDLRTYAQASYTSSSYDDPDNATQPKPSQLFFDVGASAAFLRRRAELRLTISDVFDRGGQDLRHFPLPGRTVMASLTVTEDLR
jgi:outer membrane receptor protein involved in Fe transport